MSRPVTFSEPAPEELAEAVRWYESRRIGLGSELFDAVAATIALIEHRPEIGTPISADGQTRRMLVAKFPFQIVYLLKPTAVAIVAIAHLKRRPEYWKSRA